MKKHYLFMLHFDEHCENDLIDKIKKKKKKKKKKKGLKKKKFCKTFDPTDTVKKHFH